MMKRTRTTGSKSVCLPSARTSRPRTDDRRRQKDRVRSTKLVGHPPLERLEANLLGGCNAVLDDLDGAGRAIQVAEAKRGELEMVG